MVHRAKAGEDAEREDSQGIISEKESRAQTNMRMMRRNTVTERVTSKNGDGQEADDFK